MTEPAAFDAILLLSFGGPEGPDDVIPFLENVTRGRNIPRQRLEVVAEQYRLFGGVSPINAINRRMLARLEKKLAADGPHLPVFWGNRNWTPFLLDTVGRMAEQGVRRALAFVTSAYSSHSSCRQYLDDIEAARQRAGSQAPAIEKIRPYWNHPKFLAMFAERARQTLDSQSPNAPQPRLVFSAHSLPLSMASNCAYERQLHEAARLLAAELGFASWDVVFQSRSGAPGQPWLEPDINAHLSALASQGVQSVVLVPIGFVADHMEVKYDLDTQAAATAESLGIGLVRVPTPGDSDAFVDLIHDLIVEHIDQRPPSFLGKLPASPSPCLPNCCLPHAEARPRGEA